MMNSRIQTILKSESFLLGMIVVIFIFSPFLGGLGLIYYIWYRTKWKKIIKATISLFFIFLSSLPFITNFGLLPFQFMKASGESMAPTLQTNAYFVATKVKSVQRGQIVVHRSPMNAELLVPRRVIGLPGETVAIKNGQVYINQVRIDESKYLGQSIVTNGSTFLAENNEVPIPPNYYFVLGDNRSQSKDSRDWGVVKKEDILGSFQFCYWNCY